MDPEVTVFALGVILARAGSKGLPGKCVRPLLGRPLIEYTLDHALRAGRLNAVVVSTDCERVKEVARGRGLSVIDRPAHLAADDSAVDAATRHAVTTFERSSSLRVDAIVILYANIPVRADGVIDRVMHCLVDTGADSVRTVTPVGKHHPDWMFRMNADRLEPCRPNSIHRRQDLEPLFEHDGAVVAVRHKALFEAENAPHDPHAFFGADRRAVVQRPHDTVDVDEPIDLLVAEAVLHARRQRQGVMIDERPSASSVGPHEADVSA